MHANVFEWVNSEYVSKKLDLAEWISLFKREIRIDAKKELAELYKKYEKAIERKNNLIEKLNLSKEARHAIDALNEFVSERDAAKGKYCYALLCYDLLLHEICSRLNISKDEALHYDIEEIMSALDLGMKLDVSARMNGFSIVSIRGDINILDKTATDEMIREKGLRDTFSDIDETTEFKGTVACTGNVKGKVRVIDYPGEIDDFLDGEILVTYMTTMEFTPIFKKAKGIITDEGGLSSHAAIISREFGLPCVVGTVVATRALKTGDVVELDADNGVVRKVD